MKSNFWIVTFYNGITKNKCMNCNMEINTKKSLLLYYQCTVLFPIHSQFSHMQKGSKNYHLKKAHTSQHK